jgi:hypothetical protein
MRRRRLLGVAVLAIGLTLMALIAGAPVAGGEATKTEISLDFSLVFDPAAGPPCVPQTPCHASGTFSSATAPLCSSGTVDDHFVFTGGQRDRVYTCDDGSGSFTLTMHFTGFFDAGTAPCSPDEFRVDHRWELVSGTGAFAHLRGTGTEIACFVPDATLAGSDQGTIVLPEK